MTPFWEGIYSKIVFYHTYETQLHFHPYVYTTTAIPYTLREELSKRYRHLDSTFVKTGVKTITVSDYVLLSDPSGARQKLVDFQAKCTSSTYPKLIPTEKPVDLDGKTWATYAPALVHLYNKEVVMHGDFWALALLKGPPIPDRAKAAIAELFKIKPKPILEETKEEIKEEKKSIRGAKKLKSNAVNLTDD